MRKIKVLLIIAMMGLWMSQAFSAESTWMTNFDKAKKVAAEKKIPIIMDFSGSDWCIWCQRLDKEIFSKKKFQEYVKDNFVLVLIDFPRAGKQTPEEKKINRALSEKYKVAGFPTVLILDANGKKLGQAGYMPGGPDAFIKFLEKYKVKK
jgi:protein disulfide-isomerase